jgi:hypothetical protein
VFDKTGVRSRRELVATILRQHYLPGQARPPSRPRWLLRLTSRPADCMAAHALTCTSLMPPISGKESWWWVGGL